MSFNLITGPLFIVHRRLYGVTCLQMYNYLIQEYKDPAYLKWTVSISSKAPRYSLVWSPARVDCVPLVCDHLQAHHTHLSYLFRRVLDTFDAILNGHFLYFYLVTNHSNPTVMLKVVWSVIVSFTNYLFKYFLIRLLPDTRGSYSRSRLSELESNVRQSASAFPISLSGACMLDVFLHVRQSVVGSLLSLITSCIVSDGNWRIIILIVRDHVSYLHSDPNSGADGYVIFGSWFARTSLETWQSNPQPYLAVGFGMLHSSLCDLWCWVVRIHSHYCQGVYDTGFSEAPIPVGMSVCWNPH